MEYDRDHLSKAIPESTTEGTDPEGLLSGDEREQWNDGFEQVLSVIRAEFLPHQDTFSSDEIDEAGMIASDAWNTYCGFQGDVAATIRAVRAELA